MVKQDYKTVKQLMAVIWCGWQALHSMSTDEGMRQRAATLGAAIRAEDGVGAAVRQIEAFGVASGLA